MVNDNVQLVPMDRCLARSLKVTWCDVKRSTMTAESQLVSVKLIRGLMAKGRPSNAPTYEQSAQTRSQRLNRSRQKRIFDICFATTILVMLSPIYLVLAALIAITSPGPIFYCQERIGKHHKPFRCIKFRTMVDNADTLLSEMVSNCPQLRQEFESDYKLRRDPRITRIGKFLRLTSLDELPQFWNVLRGDMSVVGPRPLVPEEVPRYGRHMDRVLRVQPGITGLWQVSGRNDIPYQRRIQIDVYYSGHHNWFLDLFIILKTVGVILFPGKSGAY